jgi:iron transport multicopper oxidase
MHRFFLSLLTPLLLTQAAIAATVTYNWDVGWISYNPDNRAVRPVIAINGKWPSPQIVGNVGDTVVVNVNNKLGNESLSIHWHGLPQTGNNANDGTPMITACPIIPGTSYTYNFTVCGFDLRLLSQAYANTIQLEQPGTYWYNYSNERPLNQGYTNAVQVPQSFDRPVHGRPAWSSHRS